MNKTYLIQITDKKTFSVLEFHVSSLDTVFRMARNLTNTHYVQVVDETNDIYFDINPIKV